MFIKKMKESICIFMIVYSILFYDICLIFYDICFTILKYCNKKIRLSQFLSENSCFFIYITINIEKKCLYNKILSDVIFPRRYL